jgi:hypothetical protein
MEAKRSSKTPKSKTKKSTKRLKKAKKLEEQMPLKIAPITS